MNILETFIKLTSSTYPHGYESELEQFLPNGYKIDMYGNYYLKIGDSDTMFCCHLDTFGKEKMSINHIIDDNYIKSDGNTILGADDKSGMTILLYMIHKKVPGLYYFFIGEEVGGIGSSSISKHFEKFLNINKCISFDRRGLNSVITHQSLTRTCSDEFASELCNILNLNELNIDFNYIKDDKGIYTDSLEFSYFIPECTNISVGYYNEHTIEEKQDIDHLIKLCMVCSIIDWDTIGVYRKFEDCIVEEYENNSYDYLVQKTSNKRSKKYK